MGTCLMSEQRRIFPLSSSRCVALGRSITSDAEPIFTRMSYGAVAIEETSGSLQKMLLLLSLVPYTIFTHCKKDIFPQRLFDAGKV